MPEIHSTVVREPRVYNRHHENWPQDAVYIGRGSKWGNPFVMGVHGTRDQVIEAYRLWLLRANPLLQDIHELKGKDLVCYCAPLLCHGDVLLEIANEKHE